MSGPVDAVAVLADLQQQVSDLTDVLTHQQSALRALTAIVHAQDAALHQLLPGRPLLATRAALTGGGS